MLTLELVRNLRAEFLGRLTMPTPKTADCRIVLSDTMRSVAGNASYKANRIKLNVRLLNANPDHIRQTVAHELAHLVAYELHGRNAWSHGPDWQRIMLLFGVTPDRCHALDVSALKRRHKTHKVYCKCPNKHVKTIRYNKMRRGVVYRCGVCNSTIYLNKQIMEVFNGPNCDIPKK